MRAASHAPARLVWGDESPPEPGAEATRSTFCWNKQQKVERVFPLDFGGTRVASEAAAASRRGGLEAREPRCPRPPDRAGSAYATLTQPKKRGRRTAGGDVPAPGQSATGRYRRAG
jgi:hypothetical protein